MDAVDKEIAALNLPDERSKGLIATAIRQRDRWRIEARKYKTALAVIVGEAANAEEMVDVASKALGEPLS